jgi:hypothetical protein
MWTYVQKTGWFGRDGILSAFGYAGAEVGRNNPEMQQVHNVGPIPVGLYRIVGPPFDTVDHGPKVLRLEPDSENSMHGRAGFLIHGDSVSNPGTASEGCIILPRAVRMKIWESGDRELRVTSELDAEVRT